MLGEADLSTWSPAAIIAVAGAMGALLGGAASWISGQGLKSWITYKEFKLKERERLAKIQRPLTASDQIWEDKNLATGYKALMIAQDERIRELEDKDIDKTKRMQELHTNYINCVNEHAEEREARGILDAQHNELKRRFEEVSNKLEEYRNLVQQYRGNLYPSPTPKKLPETPHNFPQKGDSDAQR